MELSGGVVRRSSDLLAAGVRPQTIANALSAGVIARTAHGAYHLADDAPEPWLGGLAAACARMPRAVVCLTSAAHFEVLVDEPPPLTWLAMPLQVHAAKVGRVPHRVLRWSYDGAFDVGVVEDTVCGVPIRRTTGARTVVDLIRYGRHVGGEALGIEAGRRFATAGGDIAEVSGIARQLRAPAAAMRTLEVMMASLRGLAA